MTIKELRQVVFKMINESVAQGASRFLPIETPIGSKDYVLFKNIVNQGIDSSLEGFTKSEFKKSPTFSNKFLFNFDKSELPILIRRLEEDGSDEALSWKEDIENSVEANLDEEVNGHDFLNIDDQFDIPTDLEYTPDESDIKAVEDKWGKGNFINKPISGEERDGIASNIKRSRLGIKSDEDELSKIEREQDLQKIKDNGSSVQRRMKSLNMSAN